MLCYRYYQTKISKCVKNLRKSLGSASMVGLSDRITQRPGQLSVGECQRTALVRALINDPDILLADEPTGSLDRESADNLGALLEDINIKNNISVVVVTHSERLASKMQKQYKLDNGKLLEILKKIKLNDPICSY